MVVVAIVGVLAVLAVVGFRRYLNAAHGSEAIAMIGAIKSAEEAYRAETLSYLSVSTDLKSYYPQSVPKDVKTVWGGSGDGDTRWRQLNVSTDGPVMYGYALVAGSPGATVPGGDLETTKKPTFPTPIEPWYVIQAKGDTDGNGSFAYATGNSFTNEIYVENDGE
jgi:type IV pilus assembly protein PilA